jgi:hypothetical protein
MPSMRHNISANRVGAERLYPAICVQDKHGGMNTVLTLARRGFPVADVGGGQAGVIILRRRQIGASPMCAGSATLQLMVHTALVTISAKSRNDNL